MTDQRKLYELTAQEKEHLRKLGFMERGIGYSRPDGMPASKQEIMAALKKPLTPGSMVTQKYIYTTMLKRAEQQKIIPNKTQEARDWFRKKAQNFRSNRINKDNLFKNSFTTNTVMPGRMYMFVYDAKTKDTLPYWDAFPLIFPVTKFPGGFSGLNLHYLPPILRAKLMDALYNIANNKRYDDTTKLMISYETLRSASNLSLFKPCYKNYLYDHVRSQFIYVEPATWDVAIMLPLQNWKKAAQEQVWKDSRDMVRG